MQREAKAYLWDIANASASIHAFTAGKDLDAYLKDDLLRAAVERKFGIIGEALSQLLRYFPQDDYLVSSGFSCKLLKRNGRSSKAGS